MNKRLEDKKEAKNKSQGKETDSKQMRLAKALRNNLKRRKQAPVTPDRTS